MTEKRYVVPEGMLKACEDGDWHPSNRETLRRTLEAALQWLAEHPVVPSEKYYDAILKISRVNLENHLWIEEVLMKWQQDMFLAPEKEPLVPEAIKDLLEGVAEGARILEAYRRGRESTGEAADPEDKLPVIQSAAARAVIDDTLAEVGNYLHTMCWTADDIQAAKDSVRQQLLKPEGDPLVMYIMRHFEDVVTDAKALRNRAEAAVSDYHSNYDHGRVK